MGVDVDVENRDAAPKLCRTCKVVPVSTPRSNECRGCCRIRIRAYLRTRPGYTGMSDEAIMRHRARAIAGSAQRRGKLTPKPCEDCGSTVRLEKHHDDYSKPLDVRWFCSMCHAALHRAAKLAAAAAV